MSALHDALTALYDLAPKCPQCEDHLTTRMGADAQGFFHEACDREECGHKIRCERCGADDDDRPLAGWCCAWCSHESATRIARSDAWEDVAHAEALRAANAAHEARR